MAQSLQYDGKKDNSAVKDLKLGSDVKTYLSDEPGTRDGPVGLLQRKALWKLDLIVIPIVALFYLFSFLDRSNLGNARIAGLQSDLGLSDHQYSIALTVTYIPYILAEMPANLLLKKVGANYFLPGLVTIWGFITVMEGFVSSYAGLIAVRFFLGLIEGGMFPGIVLYLSYFYTRRELQFRIALFFSAASLSGAFSGILAYFIVKMDGKGGKPGWAWIFILEGLVTLIWGVISFFIFPESIEKSKYLNPSEKQILRARLDKDLPMDADASEHMTMRDLLAVLSSPHVLINCIALFMSGTAVYSLAYFQPTIVHSLGYTASRAQLISVPPFAVSFIFMLVTAYLSDRYLGRGLVASASALIGMIGFLVFHLADVHQTSVKYGSLFLSVSGVYSTVPALCAWQSNNSAPHYRTATAIAIAAMCLNLGGILSTWLFPQSEKPTYRTGTLLNLSFCIGMIVTVAANMMWLRLANRNKVRNRENLLRDYPGHDDSNNSEAERISRKAMAELGDRHPDFKYKY